MGERKEVEEMGVRTVGWGEEQGEKTGAQIKVKEEESGGEAGGGGTEGGGGGRRKEGKLH